MASLHPALVVFGIAPNYDSAYDIVQNGPAWLSGLAQIISTIRTRGSPVLVLGSVPSPPEDIPDCVSAHLDRSGGVQFFRSGSETPAAGWTASTWPGAAAEATTVARAGGTYVDPDPWFCTASDLPDAWWTICWCIGTTVTSPSPTPPTWRPSSATR